ncbi:hypothetical protein Nepgr_028311 [Nepenthes gracilis]|uniref:Uncharacterized protein n=1 Tax=Nepenthes gracilis TaxID=150966 RepID=A0AAD3TC39_NEPGR|nr:hypothetical protein Nepgr_028311 [Nepenthes gracilis]
MSSRTAQTVSRAANSKTGSNLAQHHQKAAVNQHKIGNVATSVSPPPHMPAGQKRSSNVMDQQNVAQKQNQPPCAPSTAQQFRRTAGFKQALTLGNISC